MKHDMKDLDVDLMRLLHGELPPARAGELRERLAHEPELAARWRRLAGTWEGLVLPPAAPVPLGYGARVMARVRGLAAPASLSWSAAPRWVRATGAAALLAGVLLGAGIGGGLAVERTAPAGGVTNLTESYWAMVDESAGAPSLPSGARGEAAR